MKNFINLLLISFLLFSCSDNSEPVIIENSTKEQNLESTNSNTQRIPAGLCPDGYVAVWDFDVDLVFAKPFTTCRSGFGFCFIRTTVTLDCQRLSTSIAARYNTSTNSMKVIVEALNDSTVRLWIDSQVINAPTHSPTDFNSIEIGDFELTNGVVLKAGTYPKNTSSGFFYYDILVK